MKQPNSKSMHRVHPRPSLILFLAACLLILPAQAAKIPVILDTDIGDDIDDTWALALMLKSPELDVKLIVGDQGKARYRADLIAKLLEVANRTDIPVGIGLEVNAAGTGPQQEWVKDYDLTKYPGPVREDGVQAIIDTIMNSDEPVTVIAIGPVPNLAAALDREPRIAKKARFVGMHGSVRLGYGGSQEISAEYNVRADIPACKKALSAGWPIVITPLDTCGLVHLTGAKYRKVFESADPLAKAVIENYRHWSENKNTVKERSSTLFDTVAVYLAFSDSLLNIEELGIRVDDQGFTRLDDSAKRMEVATSWKDLAAFEDWLVERLIAPAKR